MGERGEFLPAGPTPCAVDDCPREGVALVNGRRYCGGHAAELIGSAMAQAPESPTGSAPEVGRGGSREAGTATGAVPPPGVVSVPPRLVLIENDDKGRVRSLPETVDAISEVVRAWRDCDYWIPSLNLRNALDALDERWPS